MSLHYLVNAKLFHLTEGNVAFHDTLLKFSPCHNKMLPKLIHIADTRYMHSCESYSIQTWLHQAHLHWAWNKNQQAVFLRRVSDAEAATSDLQHCWRRVCLPARQCASTSCSWHSRASAPWDTPVYQSWHVASQQSWPLPSRLPHLGHAAGVHVLSTNPQYGRVAEAICCDKGLNFSRAGWTVPLISGEKGWKHVSVKNVVILNTCCDVACLTFQLPHITTISFQSHQCLEECNITFSQMKNFAFYKAVRWHFSVWWVRG